MFVHPNNHKQYAECWESLWQLSWKHSMDIKILIGGGHGVDYIIETKDGHWRGISPEDVMGQVCDFYGV